MLVAKGKSNSQIARDLHRSANPHPAPIKYSHQRGQNLTKAGGRSSSEIAREALMSNRAYRSM